jgi:hypothetical protein
VSSSQKLTWGIVLNVSGLVLLVAGVVLSATLWLACLGIPMVVAGLGLAIWGTVWYVQGRQMKRQEVISSGVREGVKRAREAEKGRNAGPDEPHTEAHSGLENPS